MRHLIGLQTLLLPALVVGCDVSRPAPLDPNVSSASVASANKLPSTFTFNEAPGFGETERLVANGSRSARGGCIFSSSLVRAMKEGESTRQVQLIDKGTCAFAVRFGTGASVRVDSLGAKHRARSTSGG